MVESEILTVEKILELENWAREHPLCEIKPLTPELLEQLQKDMRCPIDG